MMLRILWRWIGLILIMLGVLSLTSRAFGATQPINPALDGLVTDCAGKLEPCWYGIVPGTTTLHDVEVQTEKYDYKFGVGSTAWSINFVSDSHVPPCVQMYFDSQTMLVSSIILSCMNFRTGDIATILGQPDSRIWHTSEDTDWTYGTIVARLSPAWTNSPFESALYIQLFDANQKNQQTHSQMPWQGFLPRWRYCELQPMYAGC